MSNFLNRVNKLRGRSVAELRTRAAQFLNAAAEARGWSRLARVPVDSEFFGLLDPQYFAGGTIDQSSLHEHITTRSAPRFFEGTLDVDRTKQGLLTTFNDQAVLEQANRICEDKFDLLGFKNLSFGSPPDWHLEPVSDVRTPLEHWSRIAYLDPQRAGDKKIIWELNRHQYFSTLGRAYWRTGDEKYAERFAMHIENWMESNPPNLGINWASSLEVAFRSISWIWALYFFRRSRTLSPPLLTKILKYLYLHGRHIETYLSTYFSPNTHLTGEALGLFYLGTIFPEFSCADRWRTLGAQILVNELDRHVRPDGVYFEQSSYYHRYTADFYTHFYILLRQNDRPIPVALQKKLEALLDHLMYITRPDGTSPLIGDDDGGRLAMLGGSPGNDFRSTIATGAALFDRADYKFVAKNVGEETLWLLGSSGLQTFERIDAHEPKNKSYAFTDGGFYILRDSWTEEANYILFDCGPHGSLNNAHAHADALMIDTAIGGRTLLVDPGTFTYTASKEMRDWFRSSSAHNTLTLDGESSSITDGPFSWKSTAAASVTDWLSRDRFDYVAGHHDGFKRLPHAAIHERAILFLKCDYAVIRDRVVSKGKHRADIWFHFASDAEPVIEALNGEVVSVTDPNTGFSILSFGANGRWRREEGWVSHCYGEKSAARIYTFTTTLTGDADIITFLLPQAASDGHNFHEVETINGKCFRIGDRGATDIMLLKDPQTVHRAEMERMASDFEWTWARFSNNDDVVPSEMVLLNGTTLEIQGRPIIKLEKPARYVVARRIDERLVIETDERTIQQSYPFDFRGTLI